jgi:pimeloyl-ACP methyl ester carboxylesterase
MRICKELPFTLLFIILTLQLFSQGIKREIIWSEYPYPLAEEYKERVRFGHIVVPETRNSDNPRTLKIAFCHIKGTSEKGLLSPGIMLPGGPGGSSTQIASSFFVQEHWKDRLEFMDVILFDPRGCGKSDPDLCPALDDPELYYQILLDASPQEQNEAFSKTLTQCADSLNLKGVDINAYGSDEVAEDIEDLRVSLGIEKWNIQGASYGTRYGQGVMRKFPHTVRTAVFTGLVPTTKYYEDNALKGLSRSLQLVFKACADDPECDNSYPDLEEKFFSALEYYDENPLIIPAGEHKLVNGRDLIINGVVIVRGLFILSYGPVGIEVIPKFVQAIADRNDWVITNFANSIGDTFEGNRDMNFYINANDNPTYAPSADLKNYDEFTSKLSPYMVFAYLKPQNEFAKLAGIIIDTTQQIPIPSNIPVLLSTGLYDPVTPPKNSEITAQYLTNSDVLSFPGSSHWTRGNKCYSDIITTFFKTAELPVNSKACIEDESPLKFVVDIADNRGIAMLGSKFNMGNEKEIYIPLGIALVLMIIGFLGLPIHALIRFFKRKKNEEFKKGSFLWAPWIMTLMSLAFIALMYVAIMQSIARNLYILGFGILSSWNWIFWIMGLVILLLLYIFISRKRVFKGHTKIGSTISAISWLGTFVFVGLLIYWKVLWPF